MHHPLAGRPGKHAHGPASHPIRQAPEVICCIIPHFLKIASTPCPHSGRGMWHCRRNARRWRVGGEGGLLALGLGHRGRIGSNAFELASPCLSMRRRSCSLPGISSFIGHPGGPSFASAFLLNEIGEVEGGFCSFCCIFSHPPVPPHWAGYSPPGEHIPHARSAGIALRGRACRGLPPSRAGAMNLDRSTLTGGSKGRHRHASPSRLGGHAP